MNIELTDKAIQKLMEKTCDMGLSHAVRIGITGGGCGGFEYIFDFLEHQPAKDDDIVLEYGKYIIHIDVKCLIISCRLVLNIIGVSSTPIFNFVKIKFPLIFTSLN